MCPFGAFPYNNFYRKEDFMAFLDDLEDIWSQVKISLEKDVTPTYMDLWFGTLKLNSYENNTIIFETISEFNYKVFSKRYIPILEKAFTAYFGFEQKVEVIFTGEPSSPEKIKKQLGLDKISRPENTENEKANDSENTQTSYVPNCNFQYTFENFIVGGSNKFAHAACTAVANGAGGAYNPLFIYGPSGLGKTHLMSAIINDIKKKDPKAKVIYTNGEEFTNEMVRFLSSKEMDKFKNKYRGCDILLIDDIQFIAGKTSTQEEFFHTFETLHKNNKQIVLASDRPPKDIQPLEERLRGRFEWGIIADIQPPDLELRIAIIKKKAEQVSIELSPEVLTFLAENLRSNIRQIEGMIKKLSAIVFLGGQEITMEIAASCLKELTGGAIPTQVIVDKIFSAVYNKYGIAKADLLSPKRNKDIAFARHVSIYLIRTVTEMSFPGIGKIFKRDHSSIIASYDVVNKKKNTDPLFNVEMAELAKEISTGI